VKLLIRRDQKRSLMGAAVFQLDARAELTAQEREWVGRYKMGKTLLYTKNEMIDRGSGLLGAASRLAFRMTNVQITVDDLVSGKHIECKDIVEMLAIEEQIREAAATFHQVLQAAGTFGGEELVEFREAA
jgi:hypothetical protein